MGKIDGKSVNLFEYLDQIQNPTQSFFETRNLVNGLNIHILSPDRGVINYAPLMLIGLFGAYYLYRRNKRMTMILVSLITANLFLYSLWGDPWGGWAFGSRYLIPSYAVASILLAQLISEYSRNKPFSILFFLVFSYSAFIGTLGALTTNKIPPKVQVLALEKVSGKVEYYDEARNWQYLQQHGSNSFFYHLFFNEFMSAEVYLFIMVALILGVTGIYILLLTFETSSTLVTTGEEVLLHG